MRLSHAYILLLLAPLPALAVTRVCRPVEEIRAAASYCHENYAYIAPAQACLGEYRQLVKARSAEVEKTLKAVVKGAQGDEQNRDFQTSQAVLREADSTLLDLILRGKSVYIEMDAYQSDLVLPIYEGFEEDFQLDPWAAATQKQFRENECYGEPMEELDKAKKELRDLLGPLKAAKLRTAALLGVTSVKEASLGAEDVSLQLLKAAKIPPARRPAAGPRKKPRNSPSTITGVEEAGRKEQKLPR